MDNDLDRLLAHCLVALQEGPAARSFLDAMVRLARALPAAGAAPDDWLNAARLAEELGHGHFAAPHSPDFDDALAVIEQVAAHTPLDANAIEAGEFLLFAAAYISNAPDPFAHRDSILEFCARAADLAEDAGEFELAARAHLGAGNAIMLFSSVELEGATGSEREESAQLNACVSHFEAALQHARSLGAAELTFMVLNNLASARYERAGPSGADPAALAILDEARDIARSELTGVDIALAEHNRAIYLLGLAPEDEQANRDEAIAGLHRALELRRKGAPRLEAETLLALGTALARNATPQNDVWRDAKRFLSQAIAILELEPDATAQYAVALMHLGNLLKVQPAVRHTRALSLYKKGRAALQGELSIEAALLTVNYFETLLDSGLEPDPGAAAELDLAAAILRRRSLHEDAARACACAERCRGAPG